MRTVKRGSPRGPSRWGRLGVFKGLLVSLAILLVGGLITGWALLAGSRATLDGQLQLDALYGKVTITRDALGIPTFKGDSRRDISFALGFVHAQEHFFSMDLMRRLAAGELAALVGKAALKTDVTHRQHRLRAVVGAAYAKLPPDQQSQLDSYRDGVNAGLAHLHARPWEYFVLRTPPQPWRSEDSLLVIAAMYLDLNDDGRNPRELHIAQMRSALPEALVDFLLSPDPTWEAPLQGPLSRGAVIPGASTIDLRQTPPKAPPVGAASAQAMAAVLAPLLDAHRLGSNSFAVAGDLSDTGAAILANDMHLGLQVPNIWFRARLQYPDPTAPNGERDVNGVTLPGTPAMVVGSNGQVAWGFTNSYGDWQDWVRVQRDPADPTRYKVPDGWAAIESHREVIHIKDESDHPITVQNTRWGPILARDVDGTPLALAWIGDRPRSYNLGLMAMERAPDLTQALEIGPKIGLPPQNLLVADSAGHIGWTLAGNGVPLRNGFDSTVPADWSSTGTGWTGWASAAQYPRIQNPPNGRLWTANNRVIGGDGLKLLGNGGHALGARAQQIRDDLLAHGRFGPADLLDVQLDDRANFLTRWQRLLQQTLADTKDPDLLELRKLSARWTRRAAVGSVDYTLVRAFRRQVHQEVLAPFAALVLKQHRDFVWPRHSDPENAVWMLLQRQPMNLLDPSYASWHALLLASAQKVADTQGKKPGGMAAQAWGQVNRAQIDTPLSAALPDWLASHLDMPHDPQPGDSYMPRVAAPAFGASERLDAMPGHPDRSLLSMPAGQSDNPLSPYYGAGHEIWANGHAAPLLPGPTQHTLILEPASSTSTAR